jgi:zinc/manganese transport system ATP-binding protein
LIVLHDLTLGYDRHPAVHHLDVAFPRGSLTAIVGPNGAGKSTLLRGVAGDLAPFEGRIERDAGRLAWLPQLAEVDRSFPVAVESFVAMGLWAETGAFGRVSRSSQRRIADAIAAVGLTGLEGRPIGALSGGQMQRVLFARLLLQDADLLLLDEPLAAVDARTASDLVKLIRGWHSEGRTILAVLHDLDLVRSHFPETLLLAREKVAHGPTAQVLTAENLFRTQRMCESFDHHAAVCRRGAA